MTAHRDDDTRSDSRTPTPGVLGNPGSDAPTDCSDGEWLWRYRVDGFEGVVPPFVAELLVEEDGFMLYPEDRGEWSMQHFMQAHKVVGGWTMTRAGRCRVVAGKVVESEPEDAFDEDPDIAERDWSYIR